MDQKIETAKIRYYWIGILYGFFLGIVFSFFVFGPHKAQALFVDWSDDFESYSTGDIDGQGLWTSNTSFFEITTSGGPNSGSQHLRDNATSGTRRAEKNTGFSATSSPMIISGFIKYAEGSGSASVLVTGNPAGTSYCGINVNKTDGSMTVTGDGSDTVPGTATPDTYQRYELFFDYDNNVCKGRFQSGDWSGDINYSTGAIGWAVYLKIQDTGDTSSTYFDDFNTIKTFASGEYFSGTTAIGEIHSPLGGTTTASTDVTFSFDYRIASSSYSSVGFALWVDDNTGPPSQDEIFNIVGLENVSTGSGTFTTVLTEFPTGTRWAWMPIIYHDSDPLLDVGNTFLTFDIVSTPAGREALVDPTDYELPGISREALMADCFSKFPKFTVTNPNPAQPLCLVFAFLFGPSNNTIVKINEKFTSLKTKKPVSYFYDIEDIVTNLPQSSTTTAPDLTVPFSYATSGELSFLNFETIDQYDGGWFIGQNSIFYKAIGWAAWIGFAYYLISRLRQVFGT